MACFFLLARNMRAPLARAHMMVDPMHWFVVCLLSLFALQFAPSIAYAGIEAQPTEPVVKAPPKAPVLTKAPTLLQASDPIYPAALQPLGLDGQVKLILEIDAQGLVEKVTLLSSTHPDFAAPALEAACSLRFTPAEVDNVPSGIQFNYGYQFVAQLPVTAASDAPAAPKEPIVRIQGIIKEAGTRSKLAGIAILRGEQVLATTDEQGAFTLTDLADGSIELTIRHPDFRERNITEVLQADQLLKLTYYLQRKVLNPFETIVRGQAEQREVSKVTLSREELRKVPGTFGDPIRVIENLPGVGRATGGLGGQLIVRGASPQDSQILLDGIPIPILYHFGGLTSVIQAEFLENIDFYPGNFGARYGRATAGVVDVTTRNLTCQMWRGSAKVDLIDSAAFTCIPVGPFVFAIAGRRSYIDVILPFVLNNIPSPPDSGSITAIPVYWDYQAKIQFKLANHLLDLLAFGSYDDLKVARTGSLSNVNVSVGFAQSFHRLRLQHTWRLHPNWTILTIVAPVYTQVDVRQQVADLGADIRFQLSNWEIAWRSEATFRPTDYLTLRGGLDHGFGNNLLDIIAPTIDNEVRRFPTPTFDYTQTQKIALQLTRADQAYWLELTYKLFDVLTLVPGFRLDAFVLGDTTALVPLPRFNVRYQLPGDWLLKAGYGWFARLPNPQFLTPLLGNPKLKPERSEQFLVGVEKELPWLLRMDMQGFYNRRFDLTSNSSSIVRTGNTINPEIYNNDGTGYTFGAQLLLRRVPSPDTIFYGWVAYTISRTIRQDHPVGATFTQIDGTQQPYSTFTTDPYPASFDQTHILTVVGQWLLPLGFETGFRFRYVTGNPRTPPEQGYIFVDVDRDSYTTNLSNTPRNRGRLPDFIQLDVRVDKTFVFDLFRLTCYLELINATYQKNVEILFYDYRSRRSDAVSLLPILPVLGVKGEW